MAIDPTQNPIRRDRPKVTEAANPVGTLPKDDQAKLTAAADRVQGPQMQGAARRAVQDRATGDSTQVAFGGAVVVPRPMIMPRVGPMTRPGPGAIPQRPSVPSPDVMQRKRSKRRNRAQGNEHTKGKRKSTHDKHTKPRPGGQWQKKHDSGRFRTFRNFMDWLTRPPRDYGPGPNEA